MSEEKPNPTDTKVLFKRDDDFEDLYANNVRFESNVWDLKMLFGRLDLATAPPEVIRVHTGMTLPWPSAKVMAYMLAINVTLHQADYGLITVSNQVVPPRPNPDNPELTPLGKQTVTYLRWIWDQFFGDNPYMPSGTEPLGTPKPEREEKGS